MAGLLCSQVRILSTELGFEFLHLRDGNARKLLGRYNRNPWRSARHCRHGETRPWRCCHPGAVNSVKLRCHKGLRVCGVVLLVNAVDGIPHTGWRRLCGAVCLRRNLWCLENLGHLRYLGYLGNLLNLLLLGGKLTLLLVRIVLLLLLLLELYSLALLLLNLPGLHEEHHVGLWGHHGERLLSLWKLKLRLGITVQGQSEAAWHPHGHTTGPYSCGYGNPCWTRPGWDCELAGHIETICGWKRICSRQLSGVRRNRSSPIGHCCYLGSLSLSLRPTLHGLLKCDISKRCLE